MSIARAETVGSLLRPNYLHEARQAVREGRLDQESLRSLEDRAVLEAIELQTHVGLDVITDGEFAGQAGTQPRAISRMPRLADTDLLTITASLT